MNAWFWVAVVGGVAVLLTYGWAYTLVRGSPRTSGVWWGPFYDHTRKFALLTAVTVTAYGVTVGWMTRVNEPILWKLVAGFNWSAALWVPATQLDIQTGWALATLSVWSTASINIAWAIAAAAHNPPWHVQTALGVLLFHHICVDGGWWGYRHLTRPTLQPKSTSLIELGVF